MGFLVIVTSQVVLNDPASVSLRPPTQHSITSSSQVSTYKMDIEVSCAPKETGIVNMTKESKMDH